MFKESLDPWDLCPHYMSQCKSREMSRGISTVQKGDGKRDGQISWMEGLLRGARQVLNVGRGQCAGMPMRLASMRGKKDHYMRVGSCRQCGQNVGVVWVNVCQGVYVSGPCVALSLVFLVQVARSHNASRRSFVLTCNLLRKTWRSTACLHF